MAEGDGRASVSVEWKSLKPMPTKRVYSAVVECSGQLYVIGGCDSRGAPLDTFESYNPNKNQVSTRFHVHLIC